MSKEILNDVLIEDIKPYGRNPRKNDGIPVDEVAKSIKKVGYRTPIVVDENNVILVGHTRFKAMQKLGFKKIPFIVKYTDLTTKQKQDYRVLDNKTGEFAEWDFAELHKDFKPDELKELGFDVAGSFEPTLQPTISEFNVKDSDIQKTQTGLEGKFQQQRDTQDKSIICPHCFKTFVISND